MCKCVILAERTRCKHCKFFIHRLGQTMDYFKKR